MSCIFILREKGDIGVVIPHGLQYQSNRIQTNKILLTGRKFMQGYISTRWKGWKQQHLT